LYRPLVGPTTCMMYPLFSHQKWVSHVTFLFVYVGIGHRNMTNPKWGQVLTRVWSVISKWEFFSLSWNTSCEMFVFVKQVFSSLNHPYLPILGTHAKERMVLDHLSSPAPRVDRAQDIGSIRVRWTTETWLLLLISTYHAWTFFFFFEGGQIIYCLQVTLQSHALSKLE
jgi:hypothetical protein